MADVKEKAILHTNEQGVAQRKHLAARLTDAELFAIIDSYREGRDDSASTTDALLAQLILTHRGH